MLRGNSVNSVGEKIKLYRDTMASAGFDEESVEKNLDQIWVWREMHLAETDDQALGEFLPAHHQAYSNMEEVRRQWNPSDLPMSIQRPPMDRSGYGDSPDPDAAENLVGSPKRAAEQLTLMRDVGSNVRCFRDYPAQDALNVPGHAKLPPLCKEFWSLEWSEVCALGIFHYPLIMLCT